MQPVRFQQLENGVDRGGLAGTGTAGQNEDTLLDGSLNSEPLFPFIGDPGLLLDLIDVFREGLLPRRRETDHHFDALGTVVFRIENAGQKDELSAFQRDDLEQILLREVIDGNVDGVVVGIEQVGRRAQELFPGQTGVAVIEVVVHDMQYSRPNAKPRVRALMERLRKSVHPFEGHPHLRQTEDIGVFHDHLRDIVPEDPVSVDGFGGRKSQGL